MFIDFDNVEIGVRNTLNSSFDAGLVLDALKERGEVVSKMAYGDWQRSGGYSRMAVSLTRSGASIVPGKPQRLFRIPLNDITRAAYPPYGISPDGQRFLLNVPDRLTPLFYLQGLRGMVK